MEKNKYHIYHDFFIKADPSVVYEAITLPQHLVSWWPKSCQGTAEEGCVYNFFFTSEYDWYGKVISAIPGKEFYIKMTESDKDWDPTSFGFDLEQQNGGTAVKFWHKGWPELNHHFRKSSFCWAILLQGLKDYIENGKIIPFDERA